MSATSVARHTAIFAAIIFTSLGQARADAVLERQVVAPYLEVRSPDGTGSGVAIDVDGEQLVLTAAHVVMDREDKPLDQVILVKRLDDDQYEGKWVGDVVAVGSVFGPDLALVRPRSPLGLPSAKVDFSVKPERSEDAWVIGTHSGIHGSLEKTVVNRPSYWIQDHGVDRKYMLLNGNPWYGNSGGPAFVKRGDDYVLAGIIVRLTVLNPRTPIACEKLSAVELFVKDFLDKKALDAAKAKEANQVAYRPRAEETKDAKKEVHPIVGYWRLKWAACEQDCRFDADGTYHCPKFKGKRWWTEDDKPAVVWFSEQDGATAFVMVVDWETGAGTGWWTRANDSNYQFADVAPVEVQLTPFEPIPVMPALVGSR